MIWETAGVLALYLMLMSALGAGWFFLAPRRRTILLAAALAATALAFTAVGFALGDATSRRANAAASRERMSVVIGDLQNIEDPATRKEYLDDLRPLDMFSADETAQKQWDMHCAKWRFRIVR